jgi:hypothetical protein
MQDTPALGLRDAGAGLVGLPCRQRQARPRCSRWTRPRRRFRTADTSQPVASGNTPAAADIAAMAALKRTLRPARDPVDDLDTAKVEAQRAGKRIVLDVGGEWCSWCHLSTPSSKATARSVVSAMRTMCG